MMIISPLIHAGQSATVTVSDNLPDKLRTVRYASSRILCLRKRLCYSFHPCKHTAQAFAVFACFSRLVYATVTDGDINDFQRTPFVFIWSPRLSLAPCACRIYTRLLAAMTMQAQPSNANLMIISPVHNAAKKLSPQYTRMYR